MRTLSQSNFLKIIEGRDYEFLINGYPFDLRESVHLVNRQLHSQHHYHFKNCRLSTFTVSDTDISSHWSFENCQFDELVVESSRVANFEFHNCIMGDVLYKSNEDAGVLKIHGCKINYLEYLSNPKFDLLHIGCNNLLDKVNIIDNGAKNTDDSKFYLCPEKFNAIRIERLATSKLEIGTFGEYSNLFLSEIQTDHLLLRNCNNKNSKVTFKRVSPKSQKGSVLQFLDSTIGASVFENDFFNSYLSVEYKNSSITNFALASS